MTEPQEDVVAESELLTTHDLALLTRRLADIFREERTGNDLARRSLIELSEALRRTPILGLKEALEALASGRSAKERKVPKLSPLTGIAIDQLTLPEVESLLDREDISRSDIIRLASERFGIPKSRLVRQNRQATIDAVLSSLRNEAALDVISEAARNEGARRLL